MKLKALCLGVVLLSGCSAEENAQENTPATGAIEVQNGAVLPASKLPSVEGDSESISNAPTRSELRVLSEETKAIEEHAQDVIEKFDNNLSDRGNRKEAEAEFKQMLPEYKEKMLQIGKAKLQQTK